ncbi:MAG: hypothetical protein IJ243_05050, partial [Prevotella sp.]|nr:hypothetical protein [Prevotella sp.]
KMGVSGRFDRATTEGKRSGKAKNCTKGVVLRNFFGLFLRFFAFYCAVLSTRIFQKSTPQKNLALTFESEKAPNFSKIRLIVCCSNI